MYSIADTPARCHFPDSTRRRRDAVHQLSERHRTRQVQGVLPRNPRAVPATGVGMGHRRNVVQFAGHFAHAVCCRRVHTVRHTMQCSSLAHTQRANQLNSTEIVRRHNDTPVVRASGRELSYVLLIGILMCYLVTFALVLPPSDWACGIQR